MGTYGLPGNGRFVQHMKMNQYNSQYSLKKEKNYTISGEEKN